MCGIIYIRICRMILIIMCAFLIGTTLHIENGFLLLGRFLTKLFYVSQPGPVLPSKSIYRILDNSQTRLSRISRDNMSPPLQYIFGSYYCLCIFPLKNTLDPLQSVNGQLLPRSFDSLYICKSSWPN